MQDTIQPSRAFGRQWHRWRAAHSAFNRSNDERNVNVTRNDNDWNDYWWFAGRRNSLHFSPRFGGVEFCFCNCPFHPPSILPTSSSFIERATYFLLSRDFVSHRIITSIFSASILRAASRT